VITDTTMLQKALTAISGRWTAEKSAFIMTDVFVKIDRAQTAMDKTYAGRSGDEDQCRPEIEAYYLSWKRALDEAEGLMTQAQAMRRAA